MKNTKQKEKNMINKTPYIDTFLPKMNVPEFTSDDADQENMHDFKRGYNLARDIILLAIKEKNICVPNYCPLKHTNNDLSIECPKCFGRGKIIGKFPIDKKECKHCKGIGFIKEHDTNARLIASAPLMLEALERCENLIMNGSEPCLDQALVLINQVIAKVKGE